MARKKQKPAQSIKLWSEEISKEYDRWNFLYKEGGSDPFWPDGCGLNLTRNHIMYAKRQLWELCEEHGLEPPAIFNRDLPPEMDWEYMARPDEIREKAQATLAALKAHPHYHGFLDLCDMLETTGGDWDNITCGKRYVLTLEMAAEKDNLVEMRRYEDTRYCIGRFQEYIDRARQMGPIKIEKRQKQGSLFELA